MDIPGEPRSLAEMDFVAALTPCEACGQRSAHPLELAGGDGRWVLHGACAHCARPRELVFHAARDPRATPPAALELGGPEPSVILTPAVLLGELAHLGGTIAVDARALDGAPWLANRAAVERARTALRELDKHAGPDGALPGAPGTTRAWTRGEAARWDAIAAAITADAPRILAADRLLARVALGPGHLDAAALAAHGAWLARGKVGEGRLDLVVADAEGLDAEGVDLAASRLEAVDLRGANLRAARLEDSELVDVDLRGARLAGATLRGSRLQGCWLEQAVLDAATFDRVRVEGCVLEGAGLARTRWRAAIVSTTRFRGARMLHAELAGARFTDCDFREAAFGARAAGAVFERCDFRGACLTGSDLTGAHFIRCKLAGAYGAPASIEGWSVVFADFSAAGDGSDLGDGEDLLDELAD